MLLWTLLMACGGEPPLPPVEDEPALEAMAPEPIEEPEAVASLEPRLDQEQASPELEPQQEGSEQGEIPSATPPVETTEPPKEQPKTSTPSEVSAPSEQPAQPSESAGEPAGEPAQETEAPAAEVEQPSTEAEPAAPTPTGPVKYALQTSSSSIYVQVFKDQTTAAAAMSHDHVMRASGWTGTAQWDPANPGACKIDVSVPVEKLVVDPTKLREAVGYDSTLSDSQRSDVRGNMLAKDQLNSSKYPKIQFHATSCKIVSGEKVDVNGELTIKGKTKPITVRMTIVADADGFSARGGFRIKGSDYGLDPFSAMMGALKNQDTLRFTIRLSGTPK